MDKDKGKVGTGSSSFDYLKVEIPDNDNKVYDEDAPVTEDKDPVEQYKGDPQRQALLNASDMSSVTDHMRSSNMSSGRKYS